MCKKSTSILQGYVSKLISSSADINHNNFSNSDLYVSLRKEHRVARKKRIGKGERCAAIHRLLAEVHRSSNYYDLSNLQFSNHEDERPRGGLKDLLSFTESYDFGYRNQNSICESSPLDKLIEFSENFFYKDFVDYKKSIMEILGSRDSFDVEESDCSDLEDMFNHCEETEESTDKTIEEIIIPSNEIKKEYLDEGVEYEDPSSFVQVCYNSTESREDNIKRELKETEQNPPDSDVVNNNLIHTNIDALERNYIFNVQLQNQVFQQNKSELSLLSDLTQKVNTTYFPRKRNKTFGESYINPKLQKQFLMCNFRCNTCNRRFKSYGYLKAHNSKVHNM